MEQQPPSSPKKNNNNNNKEKKRPPTAEEILSHYESQGLGPREASLKAVSDLQSLFFRAAASSARSSSSSSNTDRKLDNIGTRLSILEMKLDSKPTIPQSFALGLASGSLLSALPHIARIWNSVKSASSSSSP